MAVSDVNSVWNGMDAVLKDFLSQQERTRHLISEGLIRISAGLEDIEDLKSDIVQVLERIGAVTSL